MSLTSMLSNSPELRHMIPKNLKSQLTDADGKIMDLDDWKTPILVPAVGNSNERGTIGTAFDYFARVMIAKKMKFESFSFKKSIAFDGIKYIPSLLKVSHVIRSAPPKNYEDRLKFDLLIKERIEGLELARKHQDELIKYIENRFETAEQAIGLFLSNKITTEEYALHAIFLAKLDQIIRARTFGAIDCFLLNKFGKTYFSQNINMDDAELAGNIMKLIQVFDQNFFRPSMTKFSMNPVFPPFSKMVGGADADLIFDSTLIDFKTNEKLVYKTRRMGTSLRYSAMALATNIELEQAGIYFIRFGKSVILPLRGMEEFLFKYLNAILGSLQKI